MSKNIMILKLISGEEIICTVISYLSGTEGSYVIKNPAAIALIPPSSQHQQPSIGLGPWMPYTNKDAEIHISKSHVIVAVEPVEQMVNNYKSIFSTIITPPKTLLQL